MQNSSLILLLKTLKNEELKELGKFLQSPFFKKNSNCSKLFNVLVQYYPAFDSPKLQKEKLYYRIFSKTTIFHDGNLRTLVSILRKRTKQFLIFKELNSNEDQKQLLLLEAYLKRNANPKLIEESNKYFLDQPHEVSSWYYLNRFLFYWKLYENNVSVVVNSNLEEFNLLNHNLDLFFALNKTKLGIEHGNLVKRFNFKSPIFLLNPIKTFIKQQSANLPAILILYAELLDISHHISKKRFQEIFDLFKEKFPMLNKEEAMDICTILVNFANTMVIAEDEGKFYEIQRYEISRFGVDKQLFLSNNIFSNSHFFSIATCAAFVGEFEWTDAFINKYSPLLSPVTRSLDIKSTKGVALYLKARHTKKQEDLKKCIKELESIKTRLPKYVKRKKLYLQRVYYESFIKTGNIKILSYTENFHTYVKRAKYFKEQEKEALLHTNNLLKYMAKTRANPNLSYEKIHTRIREVNLENCHSKRWLREMITEFLQFLKHSFPSSAN